MESYYIPSAICLIILSIIYIRFIFYAWPVIVDIISVMFYIFFLNERKIISFLTWQIGNKMEANSFLLQQQNTWQHFQINTCISCENNNGRIDDSSSLMRHTSVLPILGAVAFSCKIDVFLLIFYCVFISSI